MGRIITLSVAVLMTIGGTGVVLSETVKQTSWGGTTKAAIMQVPSGETTATDPVTGFAPLSGPTMGNLMPDFDLLSDTMMGDPNNPTSCIAGYDVASQNGLSPNPDIITNPFAADLLQPTVLDQSQLIVRVAR